MKKTIGADALKTAYRDAKEEGLSYIARVRFNKSDNWLRSLFREAGYPPLSAGRKPTKVNVSREKLVEASRAASLINGCSIVSVSPYKLKRLLIEAGLRVPCGK